MPGVLKSGTQKIPASVLRSKIAIVVAEWNDEITDALYHGAADSLFAHGFKKAQVVRKDVPGSFELTLGALWMAQRKDIDAVICLGCVIQGDTPHFDYICQGVSYGITEVGIRTGKPVIFGVLTTLNKKQALERAGGKYGNKGEEAAITAIRMLAMKAEK
jgi:6,7-dimethyl-8-ribityllumazine synthase